MTVNIIVDYRCLMFEEAEDSVYLQSFGRRLAALRVQRGLTQEQLAAASGLGPQEVRRVERGQRDLSVIALADIAKALDIQPADLMP
jgi:transcriptional regulator with XRE-family HTH domain